LAAVGDIRGAARIVRRALLALALAVGCAPRPPNIVLILADDLGYGDVGAYGALRIETPHIDRLAAEGTRFTHAYTPSSICSPTRYALMTGRYEWRTPRAQRTVDILHHDEPLQLPTDGSALPALLRARGYQTAGVGKWHLGLGSAPRVDWTRALVPGPLEVGFERYFGLPANPDNQPRLFFRDRAVVPNPSEEPVRVAEVGPRFADEAVAFLENAPREPFFLYYAPNEPHIPIAPQPEFEGASHAGPYGDFVEQLDAHVGRIRAALEQGGFAERTLVVFTSDNGALLAGRDATQPHTAAHREALRLGHRSNGELRSQKHSIWDGGFRVPFIARWPGKIPAGRTRDEVFSLVDLTPTLAAAAGATLPPSAGRDGVDQLPIWLDTEEREQHSAAQPADALRDRAPPRAIVLHSAQGLFAIRAGRFKLIERREKFLPPFEHHEWLRKPDNPMNAWQLYDLDADESEQRNLWEPDTPNARQLRERLNQIRERDPKSRAG
jgi:arylsulfatase A-like enzyme